MNKFSKLAAAIAALLMVTAIVVTFEACKKDEGNVVPQIQTCSGMNEADTKINGFGERMKHAAASKSDEMMPIDEAINSLTNYQNFKMCDARSYKEGMVRLTFETSIATSNGGVKLRDINVVYETSRQSLLTKFNSMNGDGKYIYCITSMADQKSKSDSVTVITSALVSSNNTQNVPIGFGPTDYWYDCCGLGKCDIYEGQCVGRDARTQLNSKIQGIIPSYAVSGGRAYFYDMYEYTLFPDEIEDSNSASGYLLHIRPYNDSPWCLSPDELNHYLQNMTGVLNRWSQEQVQYDRYLIDFYFDQWMYGSVYMAYMPFTTYAHISVTPIGPDI